MLFWDFENNGLIAINIYKIFVQTLEFISLVLMAFNEVFVPLKGTASSI